MAKPLQRSLRPTRFPEVAPISLPCLPACTKWNAPKERSCRAANTAEIAADGTKLGETCGADQRELARKEEEKRLEELFALEAKQEESNLPKRMVAYPQKSANQVLQKPGVRRSLVAVLAAAGAYWIGAFGAFTKKTSSAKAAPSHAIVPASAPIAQKNPAANSASLAAANNRTGVGVLGLPLNSTIPGPVKSSPGNAFRAAVPPREHRRSRRVRQASGQ